MTLIDHLTKAFFGTDGIPNIDDPSQAHKHIIEKIGDIVTANQCKRKTNNVRCQSKVYVYTVINNIIYLACTTCGELTKIAPLPTISNAPTPLDILSSKIGNVIKVTHCDGDFDNCRCNSRYSIITRKMVNRNEYIGLKCQTCEKFFGFFPI